MDDSRVGVQRKSGLALHGRSISAKESSRVLHAGVHASETLNKNVAVFTHNHAYSHYPPTDEPNLASVDFRAWLADQVKFSQSLVIPQVPEKPSFLETFAPFRLLGRVGSKKAQCTVAMHVHGVDNFPKDMEGKELVVQWLRRGMSVGTSPMVVHRGVARFEQTLTMSCTMFFNAGGQGTVKFKRKPSTLCVQMLKSSGIGYVAELGRHSVDLAKLLPASLHEKEEGQPMTLSFQLAGLAEGAVMVATFGYELQLGRGVTFLARVDTKSGAARKLSTSAEVEEVTTGIPRALVRGATGPLGGSGRSGGTIEIKMSGESGIGRGSRIGAGGGAGRGARGALPAPADAAAAAEAEACTAMVPVAGPGGLVAAGAAAGAGKKGGGRGSSGGDAEGAGAMVPVAGPGGMVTAGGGRGAERGGAAGAGGAPSAMTLAAIQQGALAPGAGFGGMRMPSHGPFTTSLNSVLAPTCAATGLASASAALYGGASGLAQLGALRGADPMVLAVPPTMAPPELVQGMGSAIALPWGGFLTSMSGRHFTEGLAGSSCSSKPTCSCLPPPTPLLQTQFSRAVVVPKEMGIEGSDIIQSIHVHSSCRLFAQLPSPSPPLYHPLPNTQFSRAVVVPKEMGIEGSDIIQSMAALGIDALSQQAHMLMPLPDISGKALEQMAAEGLLFLDGAGGGGYEEHLRRLGAPQSPGFPFNPFLLFPCSSTPGPFPCSSTPGPFPCYRRALGAAAAAALGGGESYLALEGRAEGNFLALEGAAAGMQGGQLVHVGAGQLATVGGGSAGALALGAGGGLTPEAMAAVARQSALAGTLVRLRRRGRMIAVAKQRILQKQLLLEQGGGGGEGEAGEGATGGGGAKEGRLALLRRTAGELAGVEEDMDEELKRELMLMEEEGWEDGEDEYVPLDELGALAMEQIERMALEGLRVQNDASDLLAPYAIDLGKEGGGGGALGMGGFGALGAGRGGMGELMYGGGGGGAGMLTNGGYGGAEMGAGGDEWAMVAAGGGAMGLAVSLDEWQRLDAGIFEDFETEDDTLAVLQAHCAAHGAGEMVLHDIARLRSDLAAVRGGLGGGMGGGGGEGGLMGDKVTVAMLVQLRDPLRNFEPVGAPMMALLQAERAPPAAAEDVDKSSGNGAAALEGGAKALPGGGGVRRIAYNLHTGAAVRPSGGPLTVRNGANNRRRDGDPIVEEVDDDEQPGGRGGVEKARFKLTGVHMMGLKTEEAAKRGWGNQKQGQAGSRWLAANGMGKKGAAKPKRSTGPVKPAKVTVQSGDTLWSLSQKVHGSGTKWKDVVKLNPHIRNPDLILPNQHVRMR
ncbi:unnamed protein product [Closterium sp. Yama58-4]|nr:unnamed protein product [Closterium sp. Yama58-4]